MYSKVKANIMLHLVASSMKDADTGVASYNIGQHDCRNDRAAQKLADEGFVLIAQKMPTEKTAWKRRAILPRDKALYEAQGWMVTR